MTELTSRPGRTLSVNSRLWRRRPGAGTGCSLATAVTAHQQPDQDKNLEIDFEPDGLDEILLPCDVEQRYDGANETVKNAIIDDEIGVWLKAIRDKKASVTIVIDACQSGSATRGEMARIVPMKDLGIPAAKIKEAEDWSKTHQNGASRGLEDEKASGSFTDPRSTQRNGGMERLAAIYAALPTETTLEMELPPFSEGDGRGQRQIYGILSFTLNRILTNAKKPLTSRELTRQIYLQYNAWQRQSPTPLVEGGDEDKFFLNDGTSSRSPFVLEKKADDSLEVDAGMVQGFAEGTVFAVYPPAGGDGDGPLGHVEIDQGGVGPLSSRVIAVGYPAAPQRSRAGDCCLTAVSVV